MFALEGSPIILELRVEGHRSYQGIDSRHPVAAQERGSRYAR